jgi:cobalt-zinc-cadmium efflux system membrane fusion protein
MTQMKRNASPWLALVLGALLGAGATAAALLSRPVPAPSAPAAATFRVEKDAIRIPPGPGIVRFETTQVREDVPLPSIPYTARVVTIDSHTAPSYAPLEGRVAEVSVRLGDRVKKGDRLVFVRSGDLAALQRDLKTAQLAVQTKQTLVERIQRLVEARASSQNELLVAQSELSEARLAASAAGARLRALGVRQQGDIGFWVLAERDGTVVQLDAAVGKQTGPDKERPVATVADIEEVLVVADIPQKDAATLDVGAEVAVQQPGATAAIAAGKIEAISDILDPERQTVPVRVRVPNRERRLRPQAFVEAVFGQPREERVLLIPTEAVVSDGATSVVFVEVEAGLLRRRPVQLGRGNREFTEILSGLRPGERVVSRGALLLLNALDVQG